MIRDMGDRRNVPRDLVMVAQRERLQAVAKGHLNSAFGLIDLHGFECD
jgi:hypothetical protein